MNRADLVQFVAQHKYAVQASTAVDGQAQAAVVGFVVTEALELFFDTTAETRKCGNLRRDPRIAFVIGGDTPQTLQYQGIADEPSGADLVRLKALYFARFPDGREREAWPGIAYFRVSPRWIRFSDFGGATPRIEHFDAPALGA